MKTFLCEESVLRHNKTKSFPSYLDHYLSSYVQYALPPFAICTSTIKLGANRRNIVGQQLPTLLNVTCCVPLHILLYVVVSCCAKFETGQTFSPVLRPFARSLIHFFCPPKFCITFFLISPGYFSGPKRKWRQCIYSQQPTTTCNRACKRTQHVTTNNVGSCCPTILRPFAKGFMANIRFWTL